MAKLLVSVRSEVEACAALVGGAAIIDVKEPARGSLGMAPTRIWRGVRKLVPPTTIVSVALGELSEWGGPRFRGIPERSWSGIDFRKIGLAGAGTSWRDRWRDLRASLDRACSSQQETLPSWVAVVYLDWEVAGSPDPISVIGEAAQIRDCPGILFDRWDKSRCTGWSAGLARYIGQAKESGRFVALAGSLDEATIRRLRPLEPDIFAVRGAACRGGDRLAPVDPERVARLVEAVGR